jgi:hypothetical protein
MTTAKELDKAIKNAKTLAEKYTLEYYKEHNPNDKYGKSGISVTVMMEVEEFARWLDAKSLLTNDTINKIKTIIKETENEIQYMENQYPDIESESHNLHHSWQAKLDKLDMFKRLL